MPLDGRFVGGVRAVDQAVVMYEEGDREGTGRLVPYDHIRAAD